MPILQRWIFTTDQNLLWILVFEERLQHIDQSAWHCSGIEVNARVAGNMPKDLQNLILKVPHMC